MADSANTNAAAPASRGNHKSGFGGQRGGARPAKPEEVWVPITKLGRLVQAGKITDIETIFLYSIAIKEPEIVDMLVPNLSDAVLKLMSIQKQTTAGQRTRFKAFVAVGDGKAHFGLGYHTSKEVAGAIRGAIIRAKMGIVPVRLGYWGNRIGMPHTVPCKVTGRCGSVMVRLIPAPKGSGVVASLLGKKLLHLAGVDDVFSCTTGSSSTQGNYAKALYYALIRTYTFITPDLWTENNLDESKEVFSEHSAFLASAGPK